MICKVSLNFFIKYIIYKRYGTNGRRDEQLQSIPDLILKFFCNLMPTCCSIFCVKQKSAEVDLIHAFFYKQHLYKQRQGEIAKKSSKS